MFIRHSFANSATRDLMEGLSVCWPHRILTDRGGFMRWFGWEMCRWLGILAVIAIIGGVYSWADEDALRALVQQAFDSHQKSQFSAALPLLRRAHDLAPEDYFVNLLLGIDSLRTGQAKTAVPFLKKASRVRPTEEYPWAYLGEAYARQDLYGEAADAYMKAMHLTPGSLESAVAFVDFALARFANMSEVLRSSKKGLAAEYRLRAMAQPGMADSRMPLLQRAADLDPSAPGIWSDLAHVALAVGNLTDAKTYVEKALAANPNDQGGKIAKAQVDAQDSDWREAIKLINSIAENSPRTLARFASQWPAELLPRRSTVVSGPAAKFFSCVRAGSPCNFATGNGASSQTPSALFHRQGWEKLTKLPSPPPRQTIAWLERGVAFAQLDECPRAIPALERGLS